MSWGMVAVAAGTAAVGSMASNEATNRGKIAAKKAYKRMKEHLQNAQGIISAGYKSARDTTTKYSEKAQTYQDPYVEIGLEAKKYFQDLNAPGGVSSKYKEYLSVGDPLFDYADKKTSEALQRRLSALGRTDSGKGIEEDLDRSTAISYQFSDLADRRVQQEIGMQMNLLGVGQSAANTSTQLQYNTGSALSNLFTREADINAAYEAQIGGAGANYEATRGNLEMQNIGTQGQMLQGAISGIGGAFLAPQATKEKMFGKVTKPTDKTKTTDPTVIPQPGDNDFVGPIYQPTPTVTGNLNLSNMTIPTYTMPDSTILRTAIDMPMRTSGNMGYGSYNPSGAYIYNGAVVPR